MKMSIVDECLMYSTYFAPRGKVRLMQLGQQISQRYLSPLDRIVGIIGDSGAGKSLLIKGMFPGLELTNDDEGINNRPSPIMQAYERNFYNCYTYHIDVRFESAFTQMYTLAEAVLGAIKNGKRIVFEHFDLLYPHLKLNAEILIGIGEEVIVTRPNVFGPLPRDISNIVCKSLKYRKMTHTAEDLTSKAIEDMYKIHVPQAHSDVKRGFVIQFDEKPEVDLNLVEQKVLEYIKNSLDVSVHDEGHIKIGENEIFPCTGPRIHVKSTDEIEGFQLIKEFKFDSMSDSYLLIGLVGRERDLNIDDLNELK